MLAPQLKPTIDIKMCFIRGGGFGICVKVSWYLCSIPLKVVA